MSAPPYPLARCHESSLFVPWVIMTDRSRDKSARGSHGCTYTTSSNLYLRWKVLCIPLTDQGGGGGIEVKKKQMWWNKAKTEENERKKKEKKTSCLTSIFVWLLCFYMITIWIYKKIKTKNPKNFSPFPPQQPPPFFKDKNSGSAAE